MNKSVIGIIPARFKSTRLPGKPLINLLGKPMIIWVAEIASKALGIDNVYVATDDNRISSIVNQYGFKSIMTSECHETGTDRLAEVARTIKADYYINIQGDEPTIDPNDIIKVVEEKKHYPDHIINAYTELADNEDPYNENIPKVIVNESNDLVYMSRLPIPGFKDIKNKPLKYFKQVCIYAFTSEELEAFHLFGRKSIIEKSEDIEILRFFDLKMPIKMIGVDKGTYAVDRIEDIALVESKLLDMNRL